MSLISKRVSILVTTAILSQSSLAQMGFKGTGMSTVESKTGVATSFKEIQSRQAREALNGTIFKGLPKDTVDLLLEKMDTNKTIASTFKSIMARATLFKGDVNYAKMATLRMEILSLFPQVDIYDPSVIKDAVTSESNMSGYTIIRLMNDLDYGGITSPEGKAYVVSFLNQLKQELTVTKDPHEALRDALNFLDMKGLSITRDELLQAADSKEGMTSLFKGRNDDRIIEIGASDGNPLSVTLSRAKAEEIMEEAKQELYRLLDMAQRPGSIQEELNQNSLPNTKAAVAKAERFTKDNHLLDRKEDVTNKSNAQTEKAVTTYNDLLSVLKVYNENINKGSWSRAVSRFFENNPLAKKIPGSQKVAKAFDKMDDADLKNKSIREKIELVKNNLEQGIATIEKDNTVLNRLLGETINHIKELQVELARMKFISDGLKEVIADYEKSQDPAKKELAKILRSHIGSNLEMQFNGLLSLVNTLSDSISGFEISIDTGLRVIALTRNLENSIIPLMYITQSQQQAVAQQQKVLKATKITRNFAEQLRDQSHRLQIEGMQNIVKMAGESVIDPEALERRRAEMETAIEEYNKGLAEAYEQQRQNNAKLIKSHNDNSQHQNKVGLGKGVNTIINGGK